MFGFIKKCFFTAMKFSSYNILNANSLECVSMSNEECKIRSEIINVKTNGLMFYPYSITINTRLANIGPQDIPRTSPSNVPMTSPADPT